MHLKITDAPYFVKIPIRLKIPASLKISVRSKNLYLKISVRWCSGAVVQFVRSPAKVFRESRRGCRNTRPRHDHRRRTGEPQRESNKEFFLLIYRYNCTKSKIFAKKVKKKFGNSIFCRIFVAVIKQQTHRKGKRKYKSNN